MIEKFRNAWPDLAGLMSKPVVESKMELEASTEYMARLDRRVARVKRWAMERDKSEIAQRYAWLLMITLEERKTLRSRDRLTSILEGTVGDLKGYVSKWRDVAREVQRDLTRYELARKRGAQERLLRDPKQAAKRDAKDLWQKWQRGETIHKSGAAFARHVVAMLPVIESTKTVERWMKEWREGSRK